MKNRIQNLPITIAALILLISSGCGRSGLENKPWTKRAIEVSPGTFIEINERYASSEDGMRSASFQELHFSGSLQGCSGFSETFELQILWAGTNVHWKGNSIPLNLRSFDKRLFLITFDRVSIQEGQPIFRYYCQEEGVLKEISPSEYPKAIAGQNLDFKNRYFMGMTNQLDAVEIALDQDPEDIYFRDSLTAYIWNQLSTGKQYWQSSKKGEVSQKLLEDYVRTNNPIKLTVIIQEGEYQ